MVYATNDDVAERIVRHTISGASKFTTVQLTDVTDQISAEIDSVLAGKGYAVPVSAPSWFVTRLEGLNADGAASIVLKSLFPEATGPGESPAYAFYEKRYREGLKMLREGAVPSSLVTSSGRPNPSTYFTRNPDEEETLGDLAGDSAFRVGKQF